MPQTSPSSTPDPQPTPERPAMRFLRPDDLPMIEHHLRGVHRIEVRQIGGAAAAGVEVVALLEAAGLEVSFRRLELMTPPPARRLVFRYPGAKAELTIAPEVED